MNELQAWRMNRTLRTLFYSAQYNTPENIDKALLALSVVHPVDDSDFADKMTDDFQNAAKYLDADLTDYDVSDIFDDTKMYAQEYRDSKAYTNGMKGMDIINLNGKYLDGRQSPMDDEVIYNQDVIDMKWNQASGNVPQDRSYSELIDDAKAQPGDDGANQLLFDYRMATAMSSYRTHDDVSDIDYGDIDVDMVQNVRDTLNDYIQVNDPEFADKVRDNYDNAMKQLDIFNEDNSEYVYDAAKRFANSRTYDDSEKASFYGVLDTNYDRLRYSRYAPDEYQLRIGGRKLTDYEYDRIHRPYSSQDIEANLKFAEFSFNNKQARLDAVIYNQVMQDLIEDKDTHHNTKNLKLAKDALNAKVNIQDDDFVDQVVANHKAAVKALGLDRKFMDDALNDVARYEARRATMSKDSGTITAMDILDNNFKDLDRHHVTDFGDHYVNSDDVENTFKRWNNIADLDAQKARKNKQGQVFSHTMTGQGVELMVNSLKPVHYQGDNGDTKLGFALDVSKRGDIDSQSNKFDGEHVVTIQPKEPTKKPHHFQIIKPETATKILMANGRAVYNTDTFEQAASMNYDYGEDLANEGKTLTFVGNVYGVDDNGHKSYKVNPNPDTIHASNYAFDAEKHNQAVETRKAEHTKQEQRGQQTDKSDDMQR